MKKYRVGLIGAGGISDWHVEALARVPNAELYGIFDLDEQRARAQAERFGVKSMSSMEQMAKEGVDVMHILTPPSSHCNVAVRAMELGCDVLIEKPLATDVSDCVQIARVSRETGRRACVNHSLLFDPQVRRAVDLVNQGKIGRVVSVDFLRGSDYPPYAGGDLPPHYRDAAYPYRDLGVHALYLFQEFLGPIESVDAQWASHGGDPNLVFDEWRALVRCRDGLGQFQLSWNTKPLQSQLIIQGTAGVLRIDLFLMFHAMRSSLPLPKPVERIVNAVTDSVQPLIDVPQSVVKFARGRIRPFQGLQDFVGAFYEALGSGAALPVSMEDATVVVDWVERVARQADDDHKKSLKTRPTLGPADVLVTGAAGGLGSAVVSHLVREGKRVRMFVRRAPAELPEGVQVVVGNLGNPDDVERAVCGADQVVHLGAAMRGSWADFECGTIAGTSNVLAACSRFDVQKLVYISSMSVIDFAGGEKGSSIDESTALEPRAEERGFYTQAKLAAERLVSEWCATQKLPTVILRPGQIFGGKIPLMTGAVARSLGSRWLVLGDGKVRLPLVYIDDVVDAILLSLGGTSADGQVIQLIDPEPITQNDVLAMTDDSKRPVLRIPRRVVFALGRQSEPVLGWLGRQSPIAEYRLRSALAIRSFDSTRAADLLGWSPRIGVREGIRRELA